MICQECNCLTETQYGLNEDHYDPDAPNVFSILSKYTIKTGKHVKKQENMTNSYQYRQTI